MTTEQLTQFLMWCSIANMGLLTISVIIVLPCRSFIARLHGKLFRIPEESVSLAFYYFFGIWKILAFVLFIIPWACLKIIAL